MSLVSGSLIGATRIDATIVLMLACILWLHYTIIYSGDLDKVKLLRGRAIAWDIDTPAYAATAGHLHILQVVNTTTTTACCDKLLLLLL
jgi:hypothetical protein